MAVPDNIDRFNRTALVVLEELYSHFPVPVELDVPELAGVSRPPDVDARRLFAEIEPTFHAIEFLAAEAFITHAGSSVDGAAFLHVRLTMKGLQVLGKPAALNSQETLIEKVRSAIKGGVKQASGEAVKQVAELVFSAGVAAVQSLSGS
jgi:hypothetical protein